MRMRKNFIVVILVVMLLFGFAATKLISLIFKASPKTNLMERIEKAEEVVVKATGVVVTKQVRAFNGRKGIFSVIVIMVRNEALGEDYYFGIRKGDLDDIKVGHIIEVNFNPADVIGVIENYKMITADGTVIIRPKAEETKVYQIFSYKIL